MQLMMVGGFFLGWLFGAAVFSAGLYESALA
jgi:hypothetical protein